MILMNVTCYIYIYICLRKCYTYMYIFISYSALAIGSLRGVPIAVGNLRKKDLMRNKRGRVVSKRQHKIGNRTSPLLSTWIISTPTKKESIGNPQEGTIARAI